MGKTAKKRLTPSQEDYLEAILYLVDRQRVARVRDIARRLGVGQPSVSSALRALGQRGLVNYDPYQYVTLTARGRRAARDVAGRHELIRSFLSDVLGVEAEAAEANACRVEHAMDREALDRLRDFVRFVRRCPRAGDDWVRAFHARGARSVDPRQCAECLDGAARQIKRAKT